MQHMHAHVQVLKLTHMYSSLGEIRQPRKANSFYQVAMSVITVAVEKHSILMLHPYTRRYRHRTLLNDNTDIYLNRQYHIKAQQTLRQLPHKHYCTQALY